MALSRLLLLIAVLLLAGCCEVNVSVIDTETKTQINASESGAERIADCRLPIAD